MTIYRGPGGTGEATTDSDITEVRAIAAEAEGYKDAAAASAAAALVSENNAEQAVIDAANASRLEVGDVSTGAAGSSAEVTITGVAGSQLLNMVIPRGDKGDTGATGATGDTGATGATGPGVPSGGLATQVLVKNSNTDYDTAWTSTMILGGSMSLANAASTDDASIELGAGRSDVGNAYLDLHSSASSDYDARILKSPGVSGNFTIVNKGTSSNFILVNNNTEVARFDGSNNFGLGLTSPTAKLDVAGQISSRSPALSQIVTLSADNDGTSNVTAYNATGASLAFWTSDTAGLNTERGRFNSAGDFGIGTSSPQAKLHTYGSGTVSNYITSTDSSGVNLFLQASGSSVNVGSPNGVPLTFTTSNVVRGGFDSAGNFGIGNTSPSYKLDVTGSARISGISSGIVTSTSGVLGSVTAPSGTIVGTSDTQTLTNKTIESRVVVIADATSISINADTTDLATQANTQATGTLTINAPTGTLVNGQKLMLRLRSTNVQTFSWNGVFVGSTDLPLPTASSGSSKYDYMGFIYNSTSSTWQLIAKNFGF